MKKLRNFIEFFQNPPKLNIPVFQNAPLPVTERVRHCPAWPSESLFWNLGSGSARFPAAILTDRLIFTR